MAKPNRRRPPQTAPPTRKPVEDAVAAAVAKNTIVDPGQAIGEQHHPQLVPLIEAIQQIRGSKVLTYFLAEGAAIGEDVVPWMFEHLLRLGRQSQIDLFLVSRGGATEVPWRIVSLIREFCDRFCVLLPYHAASAATHISLGADEIVMTELAQLGPVDPSRQHPLLPGDPFAPADEPRPLAISVQDLRHFIQFVEKESDVGEEVKPKDPTGIYVELMRQVHPLVIGAMEQSYALAKLITKNMLELHMDPERERSLIDSLADRLADDFKSHVYPINRREAKAMGLKIKFADDALRDAMWALWRHYSALNIHLDGDNPVAGKIALDSLSYTDSELGSAVAFITRDRANKVIGGQWFAWYVDRKS